MVSQIVACMHACTYWILAYAWLNQRYVHATFRSAVGLLKPKHISCDSWRMPTLCSAWHKDKITWRYVAMVLTFHRRVNIPRCLHTQQ